MLLSDSNLKKEEVEPDSMSRPSLRVCRVSWSVTSRVRAAAS